MYQGKEQTRRQLFKDSIMSVLAAGCLQAVSEAGSAKIVPRPKRMIACRDANLKELGESNIFSAMDSIGVEGVEVTVGMDGSCPVLFSPDAKYSIADTEGVKELGGALRKYKKKIAAFCLHNRFDEGVDKEIALSVKTAGAAVTLGVPAIRIDLVPRRLQGKEDEFVEFAIQTGRRLVKETKDTPIRFGVENHGGTTNRPDFLRKLFKGVGSQRFGLTLDTANFYWFGHPLSKLYEIYSEFAPWVCHTHCKSINYPSAEREKKRPMGWEYAKYACPIYEGDIDFKRVLAILDKHEYTGDLCIENECIRRLPQEQRGPILKRESAFLRKLTETP
ncbi:MAG: sugar phosphate isomerase/epimerase family protein [Planctomycetota bacterium]|jgi:sugar phosphate isomerase/epimerase